MIIIDNIFVTGFFFLPVDHLRQQKDPENRASLQGCTLPGALDALLLHLLSRRALSGFVYVPEIEFLQSVVREVELGLDVLAVVCVFRTLWLRGKRRAGAKDLTKFDETIGGHGGVVRRDGPVHRGNRKEHGKMYWGRFLDQKGKSMVD